MSEPCVFPINRGGHFKDVFFFFFIKDSIDLKIDDVVLPFQGIIHVFLANLMLMIVSAGVSFDGSIAVIVDLVFGVVSVDRAPWARFNCWASLIISFLFPPSFLSPISVLLFLQTLAFKFLKMLLANYQGPPSLTRLVAGWVVGRLLRVSFTFFVGHFTGSLV